MFSEACQYDAKPSSSERNHLGNSEHQEVVVLFYVLKYDIFLCKSLTTFDLHYILM